MPNTVLIQTKPDEDEIVIWLTEHKVIMHDTVRINVQINAQRDDKTEEAEFRNKIGAVLNKFIPNAEWRYTSVHRRRGATRFEQITVSAVARVPEAENKQLVERANAASERGMELVEPIASFALPTDKVRQINRELRVALAQQAELECAEYNKLRLTKPPYRVALIEFADTPRLQATGVPDSMYTASNRRASRRYDRELSSPLYSESSDSPGGPGGGGVQEPDIEEGASDLGVQERIWVAAQVTLRAQQGHG